MLIRHLVSCIRSRIALARNRGSRRSNWRRIFGCPGNQPFGTLGVGQGVEIGHVLIGEQDENIVQGLVETSRRPIGLLTVVQQLYFNLIYSEVRFLLLISRINSAAEKDELPIPSEVLNSMAA